MFNPAPGCVVGIHADTGDVARILRGTPLLSSSHDYDPDSAVVLARLGKQLTDVA